MAQDFPKPIFLFYSPCKFHNSYVKKSQRYEVIRESIKYHIAGGRALAAKFF